MQLNSQNQKKRLEIMTVSVKLFAEKGFRRTSVEDILAATGIAKGTFYYYFKSKEELLDAAIEQYSNQIFAALNPVTANKTVSAKEKLIQVILIAFDGGDALKEQLTAALHQPGNELLHEKNLLTSVKRLIPIIRDIIDEGNCNGEFTVEYPETTAEFLMIAAQFMFDNHLFPRSPVQANQTLTEFLGVTEKLLGLKPGGLKLLTGIFAK